MYNLTNCKENEMIKKLKILINSRTSGKFKRELIDGRSHLVTVMMPIRGDITMNRVFYSNAEITKSFMQLDMLPAPNGHPVVNGISVPAFHPVANNKHNIGGFLRNPRKKGKRVFVDFMLDEEVANKSDEGKEVIRRIEAGEKIGVSTGLAINTVINRQGKDDFGKEFDKEGSGFNFDHVAILLNEAAAGEHAGTELVLNEDGGEILVYNAQWQMNELSTDQLHRSLMELIRQPAGSDFFSWVVDIFPDSKTFIYSFEDRNSRKLFKQTYAIDQNDNVTLIDDKIEVIKKEEFIPKTTNHKEGSDMDKSLIVLAIIGNSANKFTVKDNDKLMSMSDDQLAQVVATNEANEDSAKELLINSGFDFAGYEIYTTNKAAFDVYLDDQEKSQKETIDNIVANSEYTAEMLKGKSNDELTLLTNMLTPEKVAKRIGEQGKHIQTNSTENVEVDFT